jgi:hypothetical protein
MWLAAPLDAKQSRLSKRELAERALAGQRTYRDDGMGNFWWYADAKIAALAKAAIARAREKAANPKRQPTEKQIMGRIARLPRQSVKLGLKPQGEKQLTAPWGKGILPNQ